MKKIVDEDYSFLKQKKYKKTKLYINKFPLAFLIIFFVTIISIFSQKKEEKIKIDNIKKRRNSITNKKIKPYSNKEIREAIKNKQRRAYSIDKDLNEEYKDIQEYFDMSMNGTLYNPNEVFKKFENPKISIVITVYNGEGYLKTTLLSIQNQDFKDIEIIIVDDCSKDNSVNLIKELMIQDPRIKLYQNEQNKGMLYAKTRGVLHAKGKYVMLLDVDDIYSQRDAFSTLIFFGDISLI